MSFFRRRLDGGKASEGLSAPGFSFPFPLLLVATAPEAVVELGLLLLVVLRLLVFELLLGCRE